MKNSNTTSPLGYIIDEAPTVVLKFDFDHSHPDPSRIIHFELNDPLLKQIKTAYQELLSAAKLNEIIKCAGDKTIVDIGLLDVSQSSLRNGDKILLFSHNEPGTAYIQTVQDYNTEIDNYFTCQTQKFGPDFSNFFITVRLSHPQK